MNRRSLLIGLGAALAAPAIVRADSLMKLHVPPKPKLITALDVATLDDYEVGSFWQGSTRVGSYHRVGTRIDFNWTVIVNGQEQLINGRSNVKMGILPWHMLKDRVEMWPDLTSINSLPRKASIA